MTEAESFLELSILSLEHIFQIIERGKICTLFSSFEPLFLRETDRSKTVSHSVDRLFVTNVPLYALCELYKNGDYVSTYG